MIRRCHSQSQSVSHTPYGPNNHRWESTPIGRRSRCRRPSAPRVLLRASLVGEPKLRREEATAISGTPHFERGATRQCSPLRLVLVAGAEVRSTWKL